MLFADRSGPDQTPRARKANIVSRRRTTTAAATAKASARGTGRPSRRRRGSARPRDSRVARRPHARARACALLTSPSEHLFHVANDMRDSDALCTDCGLCCDGTFYGSVVVAAEETERLTRVGLRVLQQEGACGMPQPCAALRECLCDAYADRPSACAAYECLLRKRVSSGEVGLGEARGSIAKMRDLLSVIREGFEIPAGGSIGRGSSRSRSLRPRRPRPPRSSATGLR